MFEHPPPSQNKANACVLCFNGAMEVGEESPESVHACGRNVGKFTNACLMSCCGSGFGVFRGFQ